MDTISSMPNACLEFHPGASFETAEEVCQQSRSRLLNTDEFQVLLSEWQVSIQYNSLVPGFHINARVAINRVRNLYEALPPFYL